jgi:hypothetical protein
LGGAAAPPYQKVAFVCKSVLADSHQFAHGHHEGVWLVSTFSARPDQLIRSADRIKDIKSANQYFGINIDPRHAMANRKQQYQRNQNIISVVA